MAHFAHILGGLVTNVIVVHNNELLIDGLENEQAGREFCTSLYGGEWVQTSYNSNFRKQFAGIGYTYDADADVFIAPQPYSSWSLDNNHDWQAPIPRPNNLCWWNETTGSWIQG